MRTAPTHLLVMAKAPVPGRVKTRLCPPCTPAEAAGVAAAALGDTLLAVAGCEADLKVLALEGDPAGVRVPHGITVIAQRGSDLPSRLAAAWADVRDLGAGAGLQIGMDTPQIDGRTIDRLLGVVRATRRHRRPRALLGPAADGGWWVIGLPHPDPDVFAGVETSTPHTGRDQHARLVALGYSVRHTWIERDVDTVADLRAVAERAPHTRTAAAARALGARIAVA